MKEKIPLIINLVSGPYPVQIYMKYLFFSWNRSEKVNLSEITSMFVFIWSQVKTMILWISKANYSDLNVI